MLYYNKMVFRIYIFLLASPFLLTSPFASLYPVRDLTEAGNSIIKKKKGEGITQEKLKEAITYFKEAHSREPGNIIVIYNLANVYHHQGEFSEAIHLYQEAIDLAKKKEDFELLARLYYNLGNTYYKKEDFGKAVESYILAMDEDEHDLQIKNNFELAFNKLQKNKRPQSNPRQTQKNNKKNGRDQQSQENQEKNPTRSYSSNKQNNPPNKNQSKNNKSNNSSDSESSNTLSSKDNQSHSSSNPNLNKKKKISTSEISLERAEQILNSYQNRQKKFESFRKYNQKISSGPNSKNW